MSSSKVRDAMERVLRDRTYDRHAADEAIFQELLDELAGVVFEHKGDF